MISALEARDKSRLSEVLGRHLFNAWDRVKASL
jgi:DNA-binding GntR family transcriptional regulator